MSDTFKKIAGDSFYLYFTQGLNYILPFLILPYLIKTLSTGSFGIFIYSQAVMQMMLLFVDFGFNISATKEVSVNAEKPDKVAGIYWAVNSIKLIFAVVVFVAVALFFGLYQPLQQYRDAVIVAGISIFGSVFFPVWLFQGLGKVKLMAVLSGISKLLFLPLIFFLVKTPDDFMIAIVLHSLVQVFSGVLGTMYFLKQKQFRQINRNFFSRRQISYYIRDSFPIFLSNSSISLYTSGITFILGFFVDSKGVGVYGAIDRIVRVICFGVYGPVSQAAFPVLAKTKIESFAKAQRMLKIIFLGMLGLMTLIIFGFILFDDYVLGHYFPELLEYQTLLLVSLFSIIPISLGGICGQLGLIAMGGEREKKIFSAVYIFVGLFSLIISFFCIKYWAVEGAVYSVVASEIFVFLLMLYFAVRKRILL